MNQKWLNIITLFIIIIFATILIINHHILTSVIFLISFAALLYMQIHFKRKTDSNVTELVQMNTHLKNSVEEYHLKERSLKDNLAEKEKPLKLINNLLAGIVNQYEFLNVKDWKNILGKSIKDVCELMDAQGILVFSNKGNDENIELELLVGYGKGEDLKKYFKGVSYNIYPFSEIKNSLEKNECKIISGIDKNDDLFNTLKISSMLSIPIFAGRIWWGFIAFAKRNVDWSENEINILKLFRGIIGSIILMNKYEDEILKEKVRTEKSDKIKAQFIEQISHEIRTPLNTILSYSSLIKDEIEGQSYETLPIFFDVIEHTGRRLTRNIESIFNILQVYSGSYKVNFKNIFLYDILSKIRMEFDIEASNKGLKFKLEDTSDNDIIYADPYTLLQVFSNLVDNAIKYTSSGRVDIILYNNKSKERVCVDILDTGIGINEDALPYLFNALSDDENGYTRKFEGSGIGLTLVKRLIDMNGGSIQAVTQKGMGTVFTVSFNVSKNEISSQEIKKLKD